MSQLQRFCEFTNLSPQQFLKLDRKRARDLVWKFACEYKDKPPTQLAILRALKSFYRSNDVEILPFDSRRGGKRFFSGIVEDVKARLTEMSKQ